MVDKIMEILNQSKVKCKDKQRAACQLTDGKKPNDSDFPYRKEFSNLPDDIEQLEGKIDELQGQLDCMGGYDQSVSTQVMLIVDFYFTMLNIYINRVDRTIGNICPRCSIVPQDTNHLFRCK